MLTGLDDAAFDAWRFRAVPELTPKQTRAFIQKFLDSPDGREFRDNPDGAPGVFVFDERAPLEGLQAFGHEGAEMLKEHWLKHEGELSSGDLIVVQAREAGPFYGGSTALGKLRLAINKAAIAEGHIEQKPGHHYLWVIDFPMFTPDNETDPGQGGTAGFSATHHPFTAPNSVKDLELLRTDPLTAKADHYDLVVNGVELGGGSRRIHNVDVQKYVMRDVLKMSEERMNDFSHLFDALASGCPPHAGFAIGFDRLIAVLTGRESVKDVIAFPKSSKGEDMMVKSPSQISDKELATYHLQLNKDSKAVGDGQPVPTAEEDDRVADPVAK
jgi:aspartyl-tRNA synthetase